MDRLFKESPIRPDDIARQMIHKLIDEMSMTELSKHFYVGRWDHRNNQSPIAYCNDEYLNAEKIINLRNEGVIEFVAFAKKTNDD